MKEYCNKLKMHIMNFITIVTTTTKPQRIIASKPTNRQHVLNSSKGRQKKRKGEQRTDEVNKMQIARP